MTEELRRRLRVRQKPNGECRVPKSGRKKNVTPTGEKMRQQTLPEIAKKADDAARRKRFALICEQLTDTPRMLCEASAALLRLGLPTDTRRRVLVHVLDDPRRPCVYASRLLAGHWKSAAESKAAATETLELLTRHGHDDFRGLPAKTRETLKKLVRVQIRHLEAERDGWERGPCYSVGHRLRVADLMNPSQGKSTMARALELHAREVYGGMLFDLYNLRRRLYNERPPRYLFTF